VPYCHLCGHGLPDPANFCPACGQPVIPAQNTATPARVAASPPAIPTLVNSAVNPSRALKSKPAFAGSQLRQGQKPSTLIAYSCLGVAVLVVIGMIVRDQISHNHVKANAPNRDVPVGTDTSLRSVRQSSAPLVPNNTPQASTMRLNPDEPAGPFVRTYLERLKVIEVARVSIVRNQLSQVMSLNSSLTGSSLSSELDEPANRGDSRRQLAAYESFVSNCTEEWRRLTATLRNIHSPPPCSSLHRLYLDLMATQSRHMARIAATFKQGIYGDSNSAIDALSKMSPSEVDLLVAATDRELASICDRYRISKEFDIT
jgi:hypothetical protein